MLPSVLSTSCDSCGSRILINRFISSNHTCNGGDRREHTHGTQHTRHTHRGDRQTRAHDITRTRAQTHTLVSDRQTEPWACTAVVCESMKSTGCHVNRFTCKPQVCLTPSSPSRSAACVIPISARRGPAAAPSTSSKCRAVYRSMSSWYCIHWS